MGRTPCEKGRSIACRPTNAAQERFHVAEASRVDRQDIVFKVPEGLPHYTQVPGHVSLRRIRHLRHSVTAKGSQRSGQCTCTDSARLGSQVVSHILVSTLSFGQGFQQLLDRHNVRQRPRCFNGPNEAMAQLPTEPRQPLLRVAKAE